MFDFWMKFYELKRFLQYKPVFKQLMHAWYWFRCHTYNRYHIINISGQDDYTWGWIDRDHVMYLACFSILVDFVENEDPTVGLRTMKNYVSEDADKEDRKFRMQCVRPQLKREKEIRFLYDWWKTERKKEHDACDKLYKTDREKFFPMHIELEEKDVKMLDRLMKVRQALWT